MSDSIIQRTPERKTFEQWYVTHAFDYERDPLGSSKCAHQWAAWQAAIESQKRLAKTPFAWAIFDGEGGYDFRLYEGNEDYREQFILRNDSKYDDWVMPLYEAKEPK